MHNAAWHGRVAELARLADAGGSVAQSDKRRQITLHAAAIYGFLEVVQFLGWAEDKSAIAVLVACRRVDDVKRGLRAGALALGNRVNLIAISENDALWEGAPAVCPTMVQLVRDAVAPWSPERHFLAPPSVRKEIHTMLLVARREPSSDALIALPQELWHTIFSFLV